MRLLVSLRNLGRQTALIVVDPALRVVRCDPFGESQRDPVHEIAFLSSKTG
jgi:putative component of membrane protein insertase Oxa1/YidC/SpoIIIJ protein YidD